MRKIDKRARAAVKRWCDLPHECPNAYLHAFIVDGDLGIPEMQWRAPLDRLGRLKWLKASVYIVGQVVETSLDREIRAVSYRLSIEESVLDKPETINEYLVKQLYGKVN